MERQQYCAGHTMPPLCPSPAEMGVHQTRAYFLTKFGRIVDEPRVGQELADAYWVSVLHPYARLHCHCRETACSGATGSLVMVIERMLLPKRTSHLCSTGPRQRRGVPGPGAAADGGAAGQRSLGQGAAGGAGRGAVAVRAGSLEAGHPLGLTMPPFCVVVMPHRLNLHLPLYVSAADAAAQEA